MKILLNIESLAPPITGIGNYTQHLARGLERHRDITELKFISFSLMNQFTTQELGPPKTNLPRPLARVLRHLPFVTEIRRRVADLSFRRSNIVDDKTLYHGPNYFLYPYGGPCVVTVHDLSHVHFPQYHPKNRVTELVRDLKRSLKQATRIIAVSEFVRRELIDIMGVSPHKVCAVHNGVDAVYHPRERKELLTVLQTHGLESIKYLLSVCTLEPRKNLTGLVAAYSRLPEDVRRQHPLIIVGARGWLTESIEKALEPLERDGQVRRLGYVESEDLPFIYAGAHAFAYPSFYEGFGFPPLEAMASGVPVLTSDRSSLPEVAGGAALLVNPDDVDEIATGLERLLIDGSFRINAAKEGMTRAGRFTWENCVEGTVKVYEQAMG